MSTLFLCSHDLRAGPFSLLCAPARPHHCTRGAALPLFSQLLQSTALRRHKRSTRLATLGSGGDCVSALPSPGPTSGAAILPMTNNASAPVEDVWYAVHQDIPTPARRQSVALPSLSHPLPGTNGHTESTRSCAAALATAQLHT